MSEDREDRTEAASPRRLQRAREAGQVPISREVGALAGLAAGAAVLATGAPGAARGLAGAMARLLAGAHDIDLSDGGGVVLRNAAWAVLLAAGPLVGAVLLAGCAAGLAQTGLAVRGLAPDLSRIDPRRGLGRLLGPANLAEAAKALLKAALLGWAAWGALSAAWPSLAAAPAWGPALLADRLLRVVLRLMLTLLACQAGIAGLDLLWVRLRHARSLRMSREELRQEHKETEGDPAIKARIRRLRVARARKRMMAAVPKAAVVVTNPTHYAVALAYDRGRAAAPRVVAKGVDEVAARIREAARAAGVPLVANPPLARALHRLELDAEIPAEHFQAVAEIIAYVWRLRGAAR